MTARDVQFIVRLRDEASRAADGIAAALLELRDAQGALGSGSGNVNRDLAALAATLGTYAKTSASVAGASSRADSALDRQRAKVRELTRELQALEAQRLGSVRAAAQVSAAGRATGNEEATAAKIKEIEAAQGKVEGAIKRVTGQLQRELDTLKSVSAEYQHLASVANAVEAMGGDVAEAQGKLAAADALKRQADAAALLRDRLNPVAQIYRHMETELEKVRALHRAGAISAEEMAAAEKMLAADAKDAADALERVGRGEKGKIGLFGLKPYELTNLGYQVNDIVTGIASGQKPMQILAQQGGQLIQLFPRLGESIMAALGNPAILVAVGTFGAVALAVKQAADQAERLRTFSGILKANADGARYSAEALNADVEALKQYHITAEEAVAITRQFVKDGLNPAYFESFGMAARDMARVLGVDVKDAAQQLATSFTGGYDAIAKLDDETNFLTATEREHIRILFQSGRAAEARTEAFEKFRKRMHEGAEEMRGPWTRAVEDLDSAWERLKASFGDSAFANSLLNITGNLADALSDLADMIDRVNDARSNLPSGAQAGAGGTSGGAGAGFSLPPGSIATLPVPLAAGAAVLGMLGGRRSERGGGSKNLVEDFLKSHPLLSPDAAALDTKGAGADQDAVNAAREQIRLQRELRNATSDTDRIRIAGQMAYIQAINSELDKGNERIAQMRKAEAESAMRQQIQRGRRDDLMGTASSFLGRSEGDRQDNAALQALFKAAGIQIDPAKAAWCAAFVNAILNSKGLPTSGSQLASSFKNYGTATNAPEKGDIVVLKPQARGASGHVGFFDGFDSKGNVRVLGGNQGSRGGGAVTVSTFARNQVSAFRRPGDIGEGVEGTDSELQAQIQLAQQQDNFNKKIDDENLARQLTIKYLRDQLGLSAEALYNAEREEAIARAIHDAEKDAADKHLQLSATRRDEIKKTVGDQFDLENGERKVNDMLREQQDLRTALLSAITAASERGDTAEVERLTGLLNQQRPALEAALAAIKQYWQAQKDSPARTAALQGFRDLRKEIEGTAFTLSKLKLDALDRQIVGGEQLQQGLLQSIDERQLLGDGEGAQQAIALLDATRQKLVQLRADAIAAWQAVLADPAQLAASGMSADAIQAIILSLEAANRQTQLMGRQFLMTGQQINESLANQATQAVDNFFQSLAQGEGVLNSLWRMFAQFAADFLRQIGLMILKQVIFNAVSGGGSGAGGAGGGIASIVGSLFGAHHGGGIAGAPSMHRAVSPAVFAGARRYHEGGIAGLAPNEVPAILKRGEEVLTEADRRHRRNGGGESGGLSPANLRAVLAVGDEEISAATAGSAGEKVWLMHMKRNKATLQQELDR